MTTSLLQHDVLSYSGPEGFVASAAAAVNDALSVGAVPVVVADAAQLSDVRDAAGLSAADGSVLVALDRSVAARNPARVLPALRQHVAANDARGVRCVREPIRAEDSTALATESRLTDLILQLPEFTAWNAHVTCLYDEDLPAEVVASIVYCHRAGDPADAVDRLRAMPLPPRPIHNEELGVDRTTLSALRGFIEQRATRAGLDDERVDDLVYAVNEVVTNSLCHGEGRARVSFWSEDDAVLCEVRDRGWIRDPLAGRVAPEPNRVSGRGLWLVNQLCDLVQLRSSPSGTTVRLHVDTA